MELTKEQLNVPFPKIFALGTRYVADIFNDGWVEVTEKVDGSQFAFGNLDGELVCRSKGVTLNIDEPEKMFAKAVKTAKDIFKIGLAVQGYMFYCEYLQTPKHNTLSYNRCPQNHLALFGIKRPDGTLCANHAFLENVADTIGIDVVPVLAEGSGVTVGTVKGLLETESFLGGQKVEGVVVKKYNQWYWPVGDKEFPVLAAKYVSEKFKEKHSSSWGKDHTSKGSWDAYRDSYCTEARWQKAVQHLKEDGKLLEDPKDIGPLMKEVQEDIQTESKEDIERFLWKTFGRDLLRQSTRGLAEWYKDSLLHAGSAERGIQEGSPDTQPE